MQVNILFRLILEIVNVKYFSFMVDEVSDISRYEQISVVIRYTDDQFHIYKRFIGFKQVSSTSGDGLFNLLFQWLKKMDSDITSIFGQHLDNANVIRGIREDVAADSIQVVLTTIYVPRSGYILILYLADVAQAVVCIRNSFSILKSLYNLIKGLVKRHKTFEDIQKQVDLASTPLKQLCNIWLTCRFQSLKVIF